MNQKFQLVLRVDKELVKEMQHFGVEWGMNQSETVARLIREAIERYGSNAERSRKAVMD